MQITEQTHEVSYPQLKHVGFLLQRKQPTESETQ